MPTQCQKVKAENLCKQAGVSLVEVVLVLAIISALAFLINSFPSALASINKSRHTSIARDIASKKIDTLRKQTYDNLTNGSTAFTDSDLSSLPQSTAVYEINDCPESICDSSETVKEVGVVITWREPGNTEELKITTLVGKGGIGQ